MPRALTHKQAEAARAAVIEFYRLFCYDSAGELLPAEMLPRLYPPGHNGSGWCLSWEGNGPDEWTMHVWRAGIPPNILAEPINYCELGLYPA